jgi:hypothetical protein
MKKILTLIVTSILCLSMFSVINPARVRASETVIFQDNFDSYAVGTFPSSGGWQIVWNGAGDQYQIVTNSYSYSPPNSLQLVGSNGWSIVVKKDFSSSGNVIGYEGYLMSADYGTDPQYGEASIGFFNQYIGTWGTFYTDIIFQNGSIYVGGSNEALVKLQPFTPLTWYKIRTVLNKSSGIYNVWIDDSLVGANLVEHNNASGILSLQLSEGWESTYCYFDDVKVFEVNGPNPSGPVISSVSAIAATRLQTITIDGSGFGNTQPQTVPAYDSDGSVDTVVSSSTPCMDICDKGWAAGMQNASNGVHCAIGLYLVDWSDTEIVLGGFGSALNTNGQGPWNIAPGDPLIVGVFTPYGHAFYDVTVAGALSSTTVVCSPNPASAGSSVTCTATVSGSNPTGTVTWSTSSSTGSFSQSVCTLSSGSCLTTYSDTNAGSVTITANYSGDSNNAPSSGSTTLTCLLSTPAEFSMHWASQYYGVTAGQTTSFVIYLNYSSGFNGLVDLSFYGLPAGCTANFDIAGAQAPSVTYRTLFVTTPSTLNNGTYTFTVEGESGTVSQTIPVTLTIGTGEITGIVFRDDNGNGIRDPGEPVVSGATIGYYATTNYVNLYAAATTSNSSGEFTLTDVPFNVDNEVDVTATGLKMRSILINILNLPEMHLNVGMLTPPASGWMTCTQFSITNPSVSFSQYLVPCIEAYNLLHPFSQISVDSVESLPQVNLYIITQSSSADQSEFTQALSQYLGITAPTGYDPACVVILELPFLQTINTLFGTNIQGPITIPIPPIAGAGSLIFLSAQSISTTPQGSIVLALTFSKVTSSNQGIVDALEVIAKDLVSLAKDPDLKTIIATCLDVLNSITQNVGDISYSVITSDLDQTGQLGSYTLLDMVYMANTLSTLSTANSILMKSINLLCGGTEAATTGGLDLPADVQTIVHVLDLGFEILPYMPGLSFLENNTLYQLFMTGESIIVGIVDPNGTTIVPSVYNASGSLVLGYNFSSSDIIYGSADGLLIPAAGDWLVLLNQSANNPVNYTVCFSAIGGSAPVPYNLQVLSSNQSVTPIAYSGMVLGGTSTIIHVNVAPNGTLIKQVYLKPKVSIRETGDIYDFVATGLLSNGSLASVTRAFLIVNGSQYEMTQDNSSTFEIHNSVNIPGNVSYMVYLVSPNVPGGFASGILTQYNVIFDQTGVASDFPGTILTVDGSSYGINTLPASFWWYNGSVHAFAFKSPLIVGSGAKQYDWISTNGLPTLQSGSINVTASGSVTGNYVTKMHDVAVTSVVSDRKVIFRGYSTKINVTVLDDGNFSETVNVTLYYNITANETVGTQAVTLSPGESKTLSFLWNTQGLAFSPNYTLTAVATIPTGDFTPADNTLSLGPVKVTIMGDVNGDGTVNILDVVMASSIYMTRRGSPNYNPVCDIRGDGVIDILDIVSITKNYEIKVY